MVAASAEALAIAAYARDLGLDLAVEMYCDSAAALGITNRAGLGKVCGIYGHKDCGSRKSKPLGALRIGKFSERTWAPGSFTGTATR